VNIYKKERAILHTNTCNKDQRKAFVPIIFINYLQKKQNMVLVVEIQNIHSPFTAHELVGFNANHEPHRNDGHRYHVRKPLSVPVLLALRENVLQPLFRQRQLLLNVVRSQEAWQWLHEYDNLKRIWQLETVAMVRLKDNLRMKLQKK